MREIKFYLAGGMGGLTFDEQTQWRNEIKTAITEHGKDLGINTYCFSPPDYYNFETAEHKSEKEVREFDLYRLRNSDVVIVNFNDPNSIGTAQELAIAYEYHIPVIGLNEQGCALHPWLEECCTRICNTKSELIAHITDFYLM